MIQALWIKYSVKPRRSSWRCTEIKELRARNLRLEVLKEGGRGSRLGDSGASSLQVQQPPCAPILGAHSDGGREVKSRSDLLDPFGLITAPGIQGIRAIYIHAA